MVRTAATAVRSSGGKSTKAAAKSSGSGGGGGYTSKAGSSNKRSSAGGNPLVQRPTPKWQKPISTFFIKNDKLEGENINKEKNQLVDLNVSDESEARSSMVVEQSENSDNELCLETPEWQKPITTFFNLQEGETAENDENQGEKPKSKKIKDVGQEKSETTKLKEVDPNKLNIKQLDDDGEPSNSKWLVQSKDKIDNVEHEPSNNCKTSNENNINTNLNPAKRQKISYKQLEEFENI